MKIYVIIIAALLFKPLNAQDMYNLETCETDIATDVPQFFQDYFQCVKARMSSSGNYVNLYFSSLPPYESWYYDAMNATSSSNPNWIPFESFGAGSYQNPNVISELDIVSLFRLIQLRAQVSPLMRKRLMVKWAHQIMSIR